MPVLPHAGAAPPNRLGVLPGVPNREGVLAGAPGRAPVPAPNKLDPPPKGLAPPPKAGAEPKREEELEAAGAEEAPNVAPKEGKAEEDVPVVQVLITLVTGCVYKLTLRCPQRNVK